MKQFEVRVRELRAMGHRCDSWHILRFLPTRLSSGSTHPGLPYLSSRSSIETMTLNAPDVTHSQSSTDEQMTSAQRRYTLFLIRHGEAQHNVQEKIAQQQAQEEAVALGLSPSETKVRMEEARQRVLEDPKFFDSPLTERGVQQAQEASRKLYCLAPRLPLPTEVFVSPLQRALETAAHVFERQDHGAVRVREELRERLTGRPADNRHASRVLAARQSFARFSFRNLRRQSLMNLGFGSKIDEESDDSQSAEVIETIIDMGVVHLESETERALAEKKRDSAILRKSALEDHSVESTQTSSFGTSSVSSSNNVSSCTEQEHDMAVRAGKLLGILCGSNSESVAVVSHKAYLRALERDVFGEKSAAEFGNCEIRVYSVVLETRNKGVVSAERLSL